MEFEGLNENINKKAQNPNFFVIFSTTKHIVVGEFVRVRDERERERGKERVWPMGPMIPLQHLKELIMTISLRGKISYDKDFIEL